MWDLSILGLIPGIRVAAPRDAATLRAELREAVAVDDGPTVLRFPRGGVIDSVPAVERVGSVDVLRRPAAGEERDVLLVAVGAFGALGLAAADRLADQGIGVTVVDPRWLLPVPAELVDLAARAPAGRDRRGQRPARRFRLGAGGRAARRGRRRAAAGPGRAAAVRRSRAPGTRCCPRSGLTAQDVARRVTEWAVGPARRAPRRHRRRHHRRGRRGPRQLTVAGCGTLEGCASWLSRTNSRSPRR